MGDQMSYRLVKPVYNYETAEEILQEVADALGRNEGPANTTVREFLSWFDVQRRGSNLVLWIDELLLKYNLETDPNYVSTFIDDDIKVILRSPSSTKNDSDVLEEDIEISDPAVRMSTLRSEKSWIEKVQPTDSLSYAITRMMMHDFSQLPVISAEGGIEGVISWQTIGERLAAGTTGTDVQHFMGQACVVEEEELFFNTIPRIIDNGYVFVKGKSGNINYIFTTSDLSPQFIQLTEPFLLLSEIENHVRNLLLRWVDLNEKNVRSVCHIPGTYEGVFDLTFGCYVGIIGSELIPDPFPLNIDRDRFSKLIDGIRKIRNDVMHFSADPTPPESIKQLRDASRYLRTLQDLSS